MICSNELKDAKVWFEILVSSPGNLPCPVMTRFHSYARAVDVVNTYLKRGRSCALCTLFQSNQNYGLLLCEEFEVQE